MNETKFKIIFDPDAAKEYQKLDNSVIESVDKAIDRLEQRADEIGIPLRNDRVARLAGCKEIKLRDAGIRIIFKVTQHTVQVLQIVYILAIEQRSKGIVFRIADNRHEELKNNPNIVIQGKDWPDLKRD